MSGAQPVSVLDVWEAVIEGLTEEFGATDPVVMGTIEAKHRVRDLMEVCELQVLYSPSRGVYYISLLEGGEPWSEKTHQFEADAYYERDDAISAKLAIAKGATA